MKNYLIIFILFVFMFFSCEVKAETEVLLKKGSFNKIELGNVWNSDSYRNIYNANNNIMYYTNIYNEYEVGGDISKYSFYDKKNVLKKEFEYSDIYSDYSSNFDYNHKYYVGKENVYFLFFYSTWDRDLGKYITFFVIKKIDKDLNVSKLYNLELEGYNFYSDYFYVAENEDYAIYSFNENILLLIRDGEYEIIETEFTDEVKKEYFPNILGDGILYEDEKNSIISEDNTLTYKSNDEKVFEVTANDYMRFSYATYNDKFIVAIAHKDKYGLLNLDGSEVENGWRPDGSFKNFVAYSSNSSILVYDLKGNLLQEVFNNSSYGQYAIFDDEIHFSNLYVDGICTNYGWSYEGYHKNCVASLTDEVYKIDYSVFETNNEVKDDKEDIKDAIVDKVTNPDTNDVIILIFIIMFLSTIVTIFNRKKLDI